MVLGSFTFSSKSAKSIPERSVPPPPFPPRARWLQDNFFFIEGAVDRGLNQNLVPLVGHDLDEIAEGGTMPLQ